MFKIDLVSSSVCTLLSGYILRTYEVTYWRLLSIIYFCLKKI